MNEGEMKNRRDPHPIDVHVGARVRLRRIMTGFSQEKLGTALGLTFQQVQKYEKGQNRIGASRLYQIAKTLNVPIQFFYDDYSSHIPDMPELAEEQTDSEHMRSEVMGLLSTPEGVQLCRSFAKISDPQIRRRVLDLVKTLSEEE